MHPRTTCTPRVGCAAVVTAALLVTISPASAQEPGPWAADLDSLHAAIVWIHPDPHRVHDAAAWEDSVAALRARIDTLSEPRAALELYRILAMAAEGHTEPASHHASLRGPWLPLLPRRFADGWFVRTGHTRHARLFGKRIERIGDVPIGEAAHRIRPYVSADNEIGALDPIGNFLRNGAILAALGIVDGTDEPVTIVAAGADGARVEERVRFTDEAWVGPDWVDAPQALNPGPEPLYQRIDGNFGFEHLPDARTLYVAFHEVRDDDGETIEAFFGRAFAFADSAAAERLVLDLRENSGGNLDLLGPVLRGILRRERIDRPGHLFVITGRDTYSAAIHLAALLERYAHALFVGEPTGAGPNHFGDTREITLPHSGLVVEIAELHWQGSDPRDERPWITPDLPVDVTFADYAARRDPVLEAILRYELDEGLGEAFGAPMSRWRRPGQLGREVWPALLEPPKP